MPQRSSQRWLEAHNQAGIITRVWLWLLGALAAGLALLAFVFYAIPALFIWLVFGVLLGG